MHRISGQSILLNLSHTLMRFHGGFFPDKQGSENQTRKEPQLPFKNTFWSFRDYGRILKMLNQRGKKILTPILRQWMRGMSSFWTLLEITRSPAIIGPFKHSQFSRMWTFRFLQPYSLPTLFVWMEGNRIYINNYLCYMYYILYRNRRRSKDKEQDATVSKLAWETVKESNWCCWQIIFKSQTNSSSSLSVYVPVFLSNSSSPHSPAEFLVSHAAIVLLLPPQLSHSFRF